MSRHIYPIGYGDLRPKANYCPWELDDEFMRLHRAVAAHTLLDVYRSYSLYQLTRQAMAVPGDILEVGVWKGGSGAILAYSARLHNPPARRIPTLWLADTFAGVVKVGEHDPYYKGGEHLQSSTKIVESLLHSVEVTEYGILSGIFPEQTGAAIAEKRFCLCHIDVDVYQSAKDVLEWVWPRLHTGGIVVFDDYGFYGCEGVTKLVNDEGYAADRLFFYNLNGQAILIKKSMEKEARA